MRDKFDAHGGEALLNGCAVDTPWRERFIADNPNRPGTIEQKKVVWTKPGFKMVAIVYKHEDKTMVRSIKYLYVDGQEYRAKNDHPNPC